jgi:hypothetical protein
MAHINAPVTIDMLKSRLARTTNEDLLQDSLPHGGTIQVRYEDDEDVHCPMVLFLHSSIQHASDIPVFRGYDITTGVPASRYNIIEDETDLRKLIEARGDHWDNQVVREIKADKQLIIVRKLPGNTDGVSIFGGWGVALHNHLYLQTEYSLAALTHEWGHYKGKLYDLYVCGECKLPPNAPEGQPVCQCPGPNFLRDWDPSPDHPYNIMSNMSSEGILASDKEALVE